MLKELKRIVVGIISITLLSYMAMGCNTFKGLGKDIKKAGKTIEKTAEKTEKKLN